MRSPPRFALNLSTPYKTNDINEAILYVIATADNTANPLLKTHYVTFIITNFFQYVYKKKDKIYLIIRVFL